MRHVAARYDTKPEPFWSSLPLKDCPIARQIALVHHLVVDDRLIPEFQPRGCRGEVGNFAGSHASRPDLP